jgi:proteic killer suppression protein
MIIRNIRHKGLRRLFETGDQSGVPANLAPKLLVMLAVLQDTASVENIERLPAWRPHRLTGDLKNFWSLTVNRNWRLTFRIDEDALEILDLDFQDYH